MVISDNPSIYYNAQEKIEQILPPKTDSTANDLSSYNSSSFNSLRQQEPFEYAPSDYIQQNFEKRGLKIAQSFEKKLINNLSFFNQIDLRIVRATAIFATTLLIRTNPEKIGIDPTNEPSILFTLTYSGNKNAYLEFFFESESLEPVQTNIIIYENKKAIFAFGGKFKESIEAFFEQIPIPGVKIKF